jgi:type IV pilus assembly protein PilA
MSVEMDSRRSARSEPAPGPHLRYEGFSLIETLTVILVIAILAAIAVPVFLRHRQRGYEAQAKSSVKNAATAVEAHAVGREGSYASADGFTDIPIAGAANDLTDFGYNTTSEVLITVKANDTNYCVTADHLQLAGDWKYASAVGAPKPGTCANPNG